MISVADKTRYRVLDSRILQITREVKDVISGDVDMYATRSLFFYVRLEMQEVRNSVLNYLRNSIAK